MLNKRVAGILLHPTSLPSPYGIGDLGYESFRFIDFLEEAGQTLWQVLPLGPTGYGDSPYQCFSAFAGNPLLVSPDLLVEEKLLELNDLRNIPQFNINNIDFGKVIEYKTRLLKVAFEHNKEKNIIVLDSSNDFIKENEYWLNDYALFMACKSYFGGKIWSQWDKEIAFPSNHIKQEWEEKLKDEVLYQKFIQTLFFKQWESLKKYANRKGISIVGDMPIYVSYDSADVWSAPHLFSVDEKGLLETVAGVPPDYFSPTGQLWGNPLYKWDEMKKDNFAWWVKRFENLVKIVDVVRIDHFRGLEAYYEIPGDAKTAEIGEWVKAPGKELLTQIKKVLGELPIIAEDLGLITPEVDELRDSFNLPGMKILQFGFGKEGEQKFLPHNFVKNCVVYTGSHDNETTKGFFQREKKLKSDVYSNAIEYLKSNDDNIVKDLIFVAYASVANIIIIPMQDILELDNEARMNYPGQPYGNWTWRFNANAINSNIINNLKKLSKLFERN